MQDDFTHWWSTKPWCPITGISEYEYRKYLPEIGRWLTRDLIGEGGGYNLYGFVGNASVDSIDGLGQTAISIQTVTQTAGDCGAYLWVVNFILPEVAPEQGRLIQRIDLLMEIRSCADNRLIANRLKGKTFPFWEVWYQEAGSFFPGLPPFPDLPELPDPEPFDSSPLVSPSVGDDKWKDESEYPCTYGHITIGGRIAYYPGIDSDRIPGLKFRNPDTTAHEGWSTTVPLPPEVLAVQTWPKERILHVTWDCCAGKQKSRLSVY